MPARRIKKSHVTVTGVFASKKMNTMVEFESLLEKDLFHLLDSDPDVESFEQQPITIPLPKPARGYTPDVLVTYRTPSKSPALIEVKHTSDLERNAAKYAEKFAAAEEFAARNGWHFKVMTEKEIRSPSLDQIKFLTAYRGFVPEPEQLNQIVDVASSYEDGVTAFDLFHALGSNEEDRLTWIPVVWSAVLSGHLLIESGKKISPSIMLWPGETP